MIEQDDALLTAFAHSLAGHDPKTIRAYLSGLKGFTTWVTQQPASHFVWR